MGGCGHLSAGFTSVTTNVCFLVSQAQKSSQLTIDKDYIHHINLCDFMTRITAVIVGEE
jgi:hypothetical protein